MLEDSDAPIRKGTKQQELIYAKPVTIGTDAFYEARPQFCAEGAWARVDENFRVRWDVLRCSHKQTLAGRRIQGLCQPIEILVEHHSWEVMQVSVAT